MRAPDITRADYARALLALLPRGAAWPTDDGTALADVSTGLAGLPAGVHQRAAELLAEAFPSSTSELLPEWEASLGLPDRCVGLGQTLTERRAAVVARLTARGGQSAPYLIAVASALGFTVTIEEFAPFTAGSLAGTPLYGEAWAFALRVRGPEQTIIEFRAGLSAAGDPLRKWGNEALECVLSRIKPAHTEILFAYGS